MDHNLSVDENIEILKKAIKICKEINTDVLADVVCVRKSTKETEEAKELLDLELSMAKELEEPLRNLVDDFFAKWGWISKLNIVFFLNRNREKVYKILKNYYES